MNVTPLPCFPYLMEKQAAWPRRDEPASASAQGQKMKTISIELKSPANATFFKTEFNMFLVPFISVCKSHLFYDRGVLVNLMKGHNTK